MMKIAILKETKQPVDHRVAIVPSHFKSITSDYSNDIEIYVEESDIRCYANEEYSIDRIVKFGSEDFTNCDVFIGVKEVDVNKLIDNKTYLFFSHTVKGQPYNMPLLKACIEKNITLIDYEVIRNSDSRRLIGFGDIAGAVGTYNTLKWFLFYQSGVKVPFASELNTEEDLVKELEDKNFSGQKVLLTGKGAVGRGARKLLIEVGFQEVSKEDYLSNNFDDKAAIFCCIDYLDYYVDGAADLFKYVEKASIFIAGHYYKEGDPILLTKDEMATLTELKILGDLSCDINGPIESTIRSTTIKSPVYFYDLKEKEEANELNKNCIVVMAVDNLPCELPKVASSKFSQKFIDVIIPELLKDSVILKNATICSNRKLNYRYQYLNKVLEKNELIKG